MKVSALAAVVIAGACVACSQRLEPATNFDAIEMHVSSGFGPSYHLLVSNNGVVTPWSDPKFSRTPCKRSIDREELELLSQLVTQVPLAGPHDRTLRIGTTLYDGETVSLKLSATPRSWNVNYPKSYATSPIPLWARALGNTMIELRHKYYDCERIEIPPTPPPRGWEHVQSQ